MVDANLLIYAKVAGSRHHAVARRWFEECLNGPAQVGLPWPSLLAYVRLVSNPRIFENPMTVETAWGTVEEWLQCPRVWVPGPTERHHVVLGNLLRSQPLRSNLIPDAHLAALAIEHGLQLCSADADFARFPGLSWSNPLGA